MRALPRPLAGVLFDLDGTLVDSAPDLAAALAALCAERRIPAPAAGLVRERVTRGADAVLQLALGPDDVAIAAALPRFLALYAATGMAQTHACAGVDALLRDLEARGVPWGVVSNKAEALVVQVLARLGYDRRACAVVGGDTLARRKPDPAPLLHACALAGVPPVRSVYVGDDPRDIQAGRGAGLYTVAAGWGYVDGADPHAWGADAVSDSAADLARLLEHA